MQDGDYFIFGPETRGLPEDLMELDCITSKLRLPMLEKSRSLNLSNTVAVMLYEALRQSGFDGLG
jgi:tRNA (cytidine/uridine-2'-O-)-methyltransferase